MSTAEATLYFREKGPECLQAPLFLRQRPAEPLVDQLLASGMIWYWQSERESGREVISETVEGALVRPLTRLNVTNAQHLVADLNEIVDEGGLDFSFREVHMFGLTCELRPPIEDDLDLATRQFLSEEDSQLLLVIVRIPDMKEEYIFFSRHPVAEVRALWDVWNLNPAAASSRRQYEKLRLAQLESTFRIMRPASSSA